MRVRVACVCIRWPRCTCGCFACCGICNLCGLRAGTLSAAVYGSVIDDWGPVCAEAWHVLHIHCGDGGAAGVMGPNEISYMDRARHTLRRAACIMAGLSGRFQGLCPLAPGALSTQDHVQLPALILDAIPSGPSVFGAASDVALHPMSEAGPLSGSWHSDNSCLTLRRMALPPMRGKSTSGTIASTITSLPRSSLPMGSSSRWWKRPNRHSGCWPPANCGCRVIPTTQPVCLLSSHMPAASATMLHPLRRLSGRSSHGSRSGSGSSSGRPAPAAPPSRLPGSWALAAAPLVPMHPVSHCHRTGSARCACAGGCMWRQACRWLARSIAL